jgi:two-component system sensor histidine kinase ChvG
MTIRSDVDDYASTASDPATSGGAKTRKQDAGTATEPAAAVAWWHRYAPAHLTSRILIINLIGLVILVLGIMFFSQSRKSLIDARVQSLMTQAQIMAAAVSSAVATDNDQLIIDPERLIEQQLNSAAADAGSQTRTDFLINPDRAGPVLRRLVQNTDIRAHLFDRDGAMIVDSRYFYGRGEVLRINLPPLEGKSDEPLVEQFWAKLNEWFFAIGYKEQKEYTASNGSDFEEIRAALNGASVSVVRVNKQKEIIVSVAVPVQRFRAIQGALVLTTPGGEIDAVLREDMRVILFIFLFTALVTIMLSLLMAGHIAEPIRRLSSAAAAVSRGNSKRVEIPDFSTRRDEIGHLSGSLRDMTQSLYNRIEAIEAFAADVAHELKNPLTSLRSAVETIEYARTPEQRERLVAIVKDDVKRLDRLISDISDASRLDAELARSEAGPVDMRQLLQTFVELANETRREGQPQVLLDVEPLPAGVSARTGYRIQGHDNRLGQVTRNLIANAMSFSPPGGTVRVTLRNRGRHVEFLVEDEGPGIPPANLERVFERFYTDRPENSFGKNSGLGLSISRQIVEAHNGTITASNRHAKTADGSPDVAVSGACFTVRLPALRTGAEINRRKS